MPRNRIDLTGKKFGRLTVLGLDEEMTNLKGRTYWKCRCECGSFVSVCGLNLNSGASRSCGCLQKDTAKKLCLDRNTTHNKTNTRLFNIWENMRSRCNNTNNPVYPNYGGRGITVCKEWDDFTNFYSWAMANGYNDNITIDRVDNNGNYCPENCRWVDYVKQANNRRNNIYITINGDTKTLAEWYRVFLPNITYSSLGHRYNVEGFQSVEQLFRDKYTKYEGDMICK